MLFQKNIIKKYLSLLPAELLTKAWEQFRSYFLSPSIQKNILQSKEEQFQEGFLRELFVKVLGYTLNPSPDFNLITEQDFRELYICLAFEQVRQDVALKIEQESVSNEDQITNALYKDYSQFKRALFADILKNNPYNGTQVRITTALQSFRPDGLQGLHCRAEEVENQTLPLAARRVGTLFQAVCRSLPNPRPANRRNGQRDRHPRLRPLRSDRR